MGELNVSRGVLLSFIALAAASALEIVCEVIGGANLEVGPMVVFSLLAITPACLMAGAMSRRWQRAVAAVCALLIMLWLNARTYEFWKVQASQRMDQWQFDHWMTVFNGLAVPLLCIAGALLASSAWWRRPWCNVR